MISKEKEQLRGVGKILDILWDGCFYSMGENGAKRLEEELIYYFGKNWTKDMYKFIEEPKTAHEIKPVKTLKETLL